MQNSTAAPRSRLASRRPSKVTNLKLDHNPLPSHAISNVPFWELRLGEIDANLRSIKDFFLPLGSDNFDRIGWHGQTSLHKAARKGYEAVVEYLVLQGADIYAQDNEGNTPLDEAYRYGNYDLATLMLEKQASTKKIREDKDVKEGDLVKKYGVLKMVFALLNVGIELCQAILSQETKTSYRRLGVGLAFVCLMVSVFEMVYEARRDGVEWRKRSRGFGSLMLWFGLVSSSVQVCVNLVSLSMMRAVVKFDYTGLLLSVLYLMARFRRGEDGDYDQFERRMDHGRWDLECIHCRMGKIV